MVRSVAPSTVGGQTRAGGEGKRRRMTKVQEEAQVDGPLTRPPASSCLRCKEEPSANRPWYFHKKGGTTPLDNKFMECYRMAWTYKGSWEEVCRHRDEDDEQTATFTMSVNHQAGRVQPQYFQEKVLKESARELMISRSLVG